MKKNKVKRVVDRGQATVAAARTLMNRNSLLAVALSLFIVSALAVTANIRNSIYKTHVSLWADITTRSPNKRRAHENYGQALSTAGSVARSAPEARKAYDEALRQLQTVLALPDDGSVPMRDLYREMGVVYFRQERYDDAIEAWQTGLRHAPYDPSLLNNLSIVLLQKGRLDEAASIAESALVGDPYMPQALNTMGQVCMSKKEYEKAIQYFLRAIEREPDVPSRYWNTALAMDQARKYDLALQYANKYLSIEGDPFARQRAYQFIEHLKTVRGR